jgi:transposase
VDTSIPSTATAPDLSLIDKLGRRTGPRRLWTLEQKIQMVTESREPGASVSEVARRHGVNSNQVFAWRRLHEQGRLLKDTDSGPLQLLPVQVTGDVESPPVEFSATKSRPTEAVRVEISLPDGIRIAFFDAVSVECLQHVLRMVRR